MDERSTPTPKTGCIAVSTACAGLARRQGVARASAIHVIETACQKKLGDKNCFPALTKRHAANAAELIGCTQRARNVF